MNDAIDILVKAYGIALAEEYEGKIAAESLKLGILVQAEKDGLLVGKNQDVRNRAQAAVLAANLDYASVLSPRAAQAEIKRRVVEAQIGLTKAFWYSQSGKP